MSGYHLHTLDDCFERVRRAGEHLAELERGISEVRALQANSIPIEFNSQPPYSFQQAYPPETFYGMRMGLLVGESCYNLRSALDYLIFHLAEHDSGIPQDGTQFPIVDTPKVFRSNATQRRLKGVNAAHVAAIERLQPYNGQEWTRRLRDISNPDKHRELVRHLGESQITVHSGWDFNERDFARILGVVRYATHPTRGVVEMKVHVALGVTFSDGLPVIETIEEIKRSVAKTLTDFKPGF